MLTLRLFKGLVVFKVFVMKGGLAYTIHQIINFKEKNKDSPERIAAFVYLEFATKHHFMDGNKRAAHFAAQTFLFLYSHKRISIEYEKAVPYIIEIAANKHPLKEIEQWIKENSEIIEI